MNDDGTPGTSTAGQTSSSGGATDAPTSTSGSDGETESDAGSTTGNTGSDDGNGSSGEICEKPNRTEDPTFDMWSSAGARTVPVRWFIGAGVAEQVSDGGNGNAIRMTPEPPQGRTWTFGQAIDGPFVDGGSYVVDLRYRKAAGSDAPSFLDVELDRGGFPSASIPVIADGAWHEETVVLTFDDDGDAGAADEIALLISSFESDQVVDFAFVFLFEDCEL